MIISFKFFDKEEWSVHATLLTVIILIIYRAGIKNIMQLKLLVLASLIAMIQGELLPKLIFTFFLCLLVWNNKDFLLGTTLSLIAAIVTYYIPLNNIITNTINNNTILKYITFAFIALWFILIIKMII
jgi:hypothetical protein